MHIGRKTRDAFKNRKTGLSLVVLLCCPRFTTGRSAVHLLYAAGAIAGAYIGVRQQMWFEGLGFDACCVKAVEDCRGGRYFLVL